MVDEENVDRLKEGGTKKWKERNEAAKGTDAL